MNAKILLIALSAVAFTSCSTVYRSGQTPDDVYYSPVRPADESRNNDRTNDQANRTEASTEEQRIRMTIRDRRWRDFDDEYDYSYNNSPYNYCYHSYNNYGYYYNPYYYSKPLYNGRINTVQVNTTPRMVNLNAYKNYNAAVTSTNAKTGATTTTNRQVRQYNNSNNNSRVGNVIRQVFTPSENTNTNSSSNNNNRTYTPATNNSSSTSTPSSSSSSSSSGTPVARPGRGGN